MTQWTAGDDRPRSLGAQLALVPRVLWKPRWFFQRAIIPGDQAPGILTAMAVAGIATILRLSMQPTVLPEPYRHSIGWMILIWALIVIVAVPAVVHLVAALQTLLLMVLAPDRAGISETVQVLGYASLPAVLVGPGISVMTVFGCVLASGLYITGIGIRHRLGLIGAFMAATPAAVAFFGYGFGGLAAAVALGERLF